MVKTEISLYVFLILFTAHIGSTCVSDLCQQCNKTVCNNRTNCSGNFSVSVNTTGSKDIAEGKDITLTCVHNCQDVNAIIWLKDREIMKDQNQTNLLLKSVLARNAGKYICIVNSTCGCEESPEHVVTVKNDSVLLIIVCGVSALALIIIMGLVMKFKLKRDNEKHKERMRQRAQTGGPNPLTPRPHH